MCLDLVEPNTEGSSYHKNRINVLQLMEEECGKLEASLHTLHHYGRFSSDGISNWGYLSLLTGELFLIGKQLCLKCSIPLATYNTKSPGVIQLLLQYCSSDEDKHFISSVMDYARRCCTSTTEGINRLLRKKWQTRELHKKGIQQLWLNEELAVRLTIQTPLWKRRGLEIA